MIETEMKQFAAPWLLCMTTLERNIKSLPDSERRECLIVFGEVNKNNWNEFEGIHMQASRKVKRLITFFYCCSARSSKSDNGFQSINYSLL